MTTQSDNPLNTVFTRAVMTAEAVLNGTAADIEEKLVISQLEAALKTEPGDALLSGYMGQLLIRDDRFADALPWLEKAVSHDAYDNDVIFALATALYKTGRYGDALPHLNNVLKAFPGDHDCQMMAGYAAFKTGHLDEARALIEGAINHIDSNSFEKEMKVLALAALRPGPSGSELKP